MMKLIKVSAFIRKRNVSKSDFATLATIHFRVRGEGVDIKAASELSINPNYWSQERQGYKNRAALVSEETKLHLHNAINGIKEKIYAEYTDGVDGEWLQKLIFCYHHPDAFKMRKKKKVAVRVIDWANKYWQEKMTDKHQQSNVRGLVRRLESYEYFLRKIRKNPDPVLTVDNMTADDLLDFQHFLENEHLYVEQYPEMQQFYKGHRKMGQRSMNMISSLMIYLRTVQNYAIRQEATDNNPFLRYDMPKFLWGTPIYMTIAERNSLLDLDLSAEEDKMLAAYRDMFVFQCLVGCRHYDLVHFTTSNIMGDFLEYIPNKTREKNGAVVRVPLSKKAKEILARTQPDPETGVLFPLSFNFKYNTAIKEICKRAGLNRLVSWLNPKTRREERRPLYEVAASHMARRTFIGNLYNKVKDPNIISSMSGHCDGSRAFSRYRTIDDNIKRELVDLIE